MAESWPTKASQALIAAISFLVFSFLDLVDFLLCFVYRFVDRVLEGDLSHCYCQRRGEEGESTQEGKRLSETLYGRRSLFRETVSAVDFRGGAPKGSLKKPPRWSDCRCQSCRSSQRKERLHFVLKEPAADSRNKDYGKGSIESIIFLHGFLSSSTLWDETVFPNLSESTKLCHRMFAVDLLGFGKSPKPTDGLYTIEDHIHMIEISVLKPFQVNSFHIVAHSMGCVIALALAAKYPRMVKSVTLVAAPYFPSTTRAKASETILNRLAERKIWPPFLFGASVMSWYEHLGRTICFLVCRNHLTWEWIIKLVTRRDVHFMMIDLTKHTHHSAWHTMHNVICGAANSMDEYLKVMKIAGTPFKILQGSKDQLVPHECSFNIKLKVSHAELHVISGADHSTVIIGREKAFTRELEEFWFSSREHGMHKSTMC